MEPIVYTYDEAYQASLEYFKGDELVDASSLFGSGNLYINDNWLDSHHEYEPLKGYTDGQLGIIFRMLLGIQKSLTV